MLNGYQKAQQLQLTGTPEQIVPVLHALTVDKIPVAEVIQFFDEQNLAEHDPIDNVWKGSLIDVVKHPASPEPVVAGLRALFVHIGKRTSEAVDTTDPTIAVQTWTLLNVLIQMGVVTVEQREAFYALDGGRPYAALSVEEYSAQATAAEEEAAKDILRYHLNTLRQSFDAKTNVALDNIRLGSITTYAELVAAVQVGV
jgi:hypothetical protein